MDLHTLSQTPSGSLHTSSTPPSSASDSAGAEYAWLVHSQNTLRDTLPPNVDNKPLARQRRRRTSPEDQAILEAEYDKNPKPDKNTRKAIVERVSGMGEKEVQIWFQNRRQNSRRRAAPLSPGAAVSSLYQGESSPPPADIPRSSQFQLDTSSAAEPDLQAMVAEACGPALDGTVLEQESSNPPVIANELHAKMALKDINTGSRSLKRTSSGVRISLTSEGSARLTHANESSPSPPRPERRLTGLLDDDLEDLVFDPSFSVGSRANPKLRRPPSGRSRDSRSWEFWCDPESRNELTLKAQQEESGSASEAISLMRSQNTRPALSSMDRSTWLRRSDSTKLVKRSRPSLGRSSTISAFPRSGKKNGFDLFEDGTPTSDDLSNKDTRLLKSPTGESDKENRDPNLSELSRRRQPKNQGMEKPKLHKSRTAPSQRMSTTLSLAEKRRSAAQKRDRFDPEEDKELSQFMGGGRGKEHPGISSAEDLTCVQSLLFLSQGH